MLMRRDRWRVRSRALRGLPGTREGDVAAFAGLTGFAHAHLREAFAEACGALGLTPVGEATPSPWHKSIGAEVRGLDGTSYWMKVSGIVASAAVWWREGEASAGALSGPPKPIVHKVHDWTAERVQWRALLMSPAPAPAIAGQRCFGLGDPVPTDAWIASLKDALDRVGRMPASRLCWSREHIAWCITSRFGRRAPQRVDEWRTAHGDLNWTHLTAPELWLLDWEAWGLAPRGFDAATLIVNSWADPDLVARLRAAFADDLDTPSGRVAQLLSCAHQLTFVEAGFADPRSHRPVEEIAHEILRSR